MTDEELLVIYGGIRSLAASMEAREAALQNSTAALDASIAQVQQLPAWLGQQTGQYIAAGIRKVVREDFGQPIEKAVEGPIRSIETAAYHAREAVGQLKEQSRYLNWTWFAIVLALGFALGGVGNYFLFTRQVSALNDRFDHLQQLLLTPAPASADLQPTPQQTKKKRGAH